MTNASELLKGTTPAFGNGEARVAWVAAEQALLDDYLADYVMTLDNGGDYTPTDWERVLIEDALQGFLNEHDELLSQHLARQVTQLEAQLAERDNLLEKLCDLEAAIEHLPEPMCANLYEIIDAYRAQSKEPK